MTGANTKLSRSTKINTVAVPALTARLPSRKLGEVLLNERWRKWAAIYPSFERLGKCAVRCNMVVAISDFMPDAIVDIV